VNPRRLIEEDPHSVAAQLLSVGRTMQPPEVTYHKTLASLGLGAAALSSAGSAGAATAPSLLGAIWLGTAVKGLCVGVLVGASLVGLGRASSHWWNPAPSIQSGKVPSSLPLAVSTVDAQHVAPDVLLPRPDQVVVAPNASSSERSSAPLVDRIPTVPSSEVPSKAAGALSASKSSLGAEVALLDLVRRTLEGGQAGRALEYLDRYRLQFQTPRLAEEASFLRAQVLERLGRRSEAAAAFEAFHRTYPDSALSEPRPKSQSMAP
jgi:hypothetical protein